MPVESVEVRCARADEAEVVGRLTELAYRFDGHLSGSSGYASELRDAARRIREARVLVAALGGAVVGTVTLACAGSPYAEIARPGELEVRMLAVAPHVRRRGIATSLAHAAERAARSGGHEAVVLCTGAWMLSAQRLYERLGYQRLAERDWSAAERRLLAYRLRLAPVAPLAQRAAAGGTRGASRPPAGATPVGDG